MCHNLLVYVQGLIFPLPSRLHDFSFPLPDVSVRWCDNIKATQKQLRALRAALGQLRALDAPGAVLSFTGWQWSQALADVLTEALPSLSHLNITVPEVTHNAGEWHRV